MDMPQQVIQDEAGNTLTLSKSGSNDFKITHAADGFLIMSTFPQIQPTI